MSIRKVSKLFLPFLLFVFFYGICFSQEAPARNASHSEAGGNVAMIDSVEGDVLILPSGKREWKPAKEAMVLVSGDTISSYEESSCLIKFEDGSTIRIKENSYSFCNLFY